MALRSALTSVVMLGTAACLATAMQSQGPGLGGGVPSPAGAGSGSSENTGPISRDDAASTLTGRIIVKFTADSGLLAPMAAAPFPIPSEEGDSVALNNALAASGATVTRWIAQPDEVLIELTERALANSGRQQPDLRQFAYVDPPSGLVLDTADMLTQVPEVEWVYVERALVMAQDGQGCGGLLTPNCWEPNCDQVGGCNPDPGCNLDPPVCEFGCIDAACCARVAAIMPSCVDPDAPRGWDPVCAQLANMVCEGDPSNNYGVAKDLPFSYFLLGDCFQARPYTAGAYLGGCSNIDCAAAVCVVDPYCCTLEWDSQCVETAASPVLRAACGSPVAREQTPDFTARVEPVVEQAIWGGLGGGFTFAYPALRARGLQTYTVGEPVVGFDRFVNVLEPKPPFDDGLEFLESGFRGWGLDLEKMRALATQYGAKSGTPTRLNGAGIRIGVIDFAYDEFHEEFVCAEQVAGSVTGECAEFYAVPRVIPEAGQTPWISLAAAERAHGTAVLAMLVAGDNGFGVTGIAHEAQGYFYPASSVEQGFRLQNAFVSMLLEFEPGDVCVIPMALAPDDGIGPNEIFSQPIVISPAYASLIGVGSDIGILSVVPARNSSALTLPEPDGIDSQALVVGAGMPGQLLVDGISPLGYPIWEFSRVPSSNYTDGTTIDLFAWGSNVVTAGGLGDLFSGLRPNSNPGYSRDYTDSFGGTSAAASMIGGAAAVLQAFALQELDVPASPRQLSKVLRNNGMAQGGWPFNSPDFEGVGETAVSVLPVGPVEADDPIQARLGFSDFNRANFPQLVEAANDLIFEANDCAFVALEPAAPPAVAPDAEEGLEIEVTLGGGIGQGDTCSWVAISTVPWITVTTAAGTGAPLDNIIRYDIEANNETIEAREGAIIFIGGSVTVEIPIVQAGCALLNVPGPLQFGPDGTTTGFGIPFDVTLAWNGEECGWSAATTTSWITLVTDSGTGGPPDNVLSFDVAASPIASPREGTITVTSSAGIDYQIQVIQAPCAVTAVQPPAPVFPADGTTGGFGDPAQLDLTLSGENCTWSASTTTPWITILTPSGGGLPPDNVVRYTVPPNPGQVQRQGFVRITLAGGSFVNVLVTQTACTLVAFDPPLAILGADGTAGGFGDPEDVTLNWSGEDCSWTASTTDSWITVLTTSGTGAPLENIIEYAVAPNTTQIARQGRIRVVSGGGAEFFFPITQTQCVLQLVDPPAPIFGPDGTTAGGGIPAQITLTWSGETCGWTATTTTPWITLVTSSGGGAPPNNVVRYLVAANENTQVPRVGRITVTSTGGQVTQINVTQGPCALVGAVPGPFGFGPDGVLQQQVPVNLNGSTCEWVATTAVSWIVLTRDSGTGAPFDNNLEFSVLPNIVGAARQGNIVVNLEGGAQFQVLVQQQTCVLEAFNPPQFANVPSAGLDNAQILLDFSGDQCQWTASANQSWIVFSIAQGSGAIGQTTVEFDVLPNNSNLTRSAVITVLGANGVTQAIPLTQQASSGYPQSYTIVTGTESTTYAPSRLQAIDNIAVVINAQTANSGGNYQGLTYLAGGKITDIIYQTVYGGVNAPPPGQPFNINGLVILNRAFSTSPSTLRLIYLRNRNTGVWTYLSTDNMPVGAYPQGAQAFQLPATTDPLFFVNPTTGQVDVRIWTVVLGNAATNTVSHDLIQAGPVVTFDGGDVATSDDSSERVGTDDGDASTQELTGDQGCVPITVTQPPMRFGPEGVALSFFEVGIGGERCPRMAISENDWIEVIPADDLGLGFEGVIEFSVLPFDGPEPVRTGWIRIVTGDGARLRVPITQGACEPADGGDLEVTEPISVSWQGERGLVVPVGSAVGSCRWSASSDSEWIELLVEEGSVSDARGAVVMNVRPNDGLSPRTATIEVQWDGGEIRTIRVVQDGRGPLPSRPRSGR